MIGKNKLTRRDFVKRTAVAGAGVAMLSKFAVPRAWALNNSPGIPKWKTAIRGLNYQSGHILGLLGYPNDPLGIPVAQPTPDAVFPNTDFYNLAVMEFGDDITGSFFKNSPTNPGNLTGQTKLWGYVDLNVPANTPLVARHLGGLIVTTRGKAARLRFTNLLPNQHLLPCDITLPGANQAQNRIATHLHGGWVPWISDGGPFDWFTPGCGNYAHGLSFSNGPADPGKFGIDPLHPLDNIPAGIIPGVGPMVAGQADYYYPNNQSTRLMWYHDHAWGITRLNAYAGIATGYLCVDLANDGLRLTAQTPAYKDLWPIVWQEKKFVNGAPAVGLTPATGTFLSDPVWQDIARPDTQVPGSLWYEHTYNPKLWTLKAGLPLPDPSVIAEFFGDTILVNGTAYPKLTVDPKAYRMMFLNATNARFFNINTFVADTIGLVATPNPDGINLNKQTQFPANRPGPVIHQIGNEAGYLSKQVDFATSALTQFNPATLTGGLIMGPAERADVVIDFAPFAGMDIIIYNDAPAPFPGGAPINDYYLGNAANPIVTVAGQGPDTRQLLRITVRATLPPDPVTGVIPPTVANTGPFLTDNGPLDPPALAPVPAAVPGGPIAGGTLIPVLVPTVPVPATAPVPGSLAGGTRKLTLNETFDRYGRLIQLLGTTTFNAATGTFGKALTDPVTENPTAGTTEIWEIYNTTADTHPMHFHLFNAQVLSRQPFKLVSNVPTLSGVARGPDANELGWKETIKMNPGEVTRILMKFELPATPFVVPPSPRTGGNEYVWHCHILEHEEHDMMRPMVVT